MRGTLESRLAVLAVGFGTTVAMWAVGYVSHLPAVSVPGPVVFFAMLACLLAGGLTLGRYGGFGAATGAVAGLVTSIVNLLILGSVISGGDGAIVPSALVWGPGSLAVGAVLGAIGAVIGRRWPGPRYDAIAWRSGLMLVGVTATFLVVIAGGLVTSLEAGLAVPDWPNSFRSNMFLYPLARMTGGIYYEHAHRLYGSLVGLTTIVAAITLWTTDRRTWMRWLGVVAVVGVVAQGVLGGLRVTGELTLSDDPSVLVPNTNLAIVHGITGQLFFAFFGLLWAFTSRAWTAPRGASSPATAGDRTASTAFLILLVGQLGLGAMYRHLSTEEEPLPWPALAHVALALVVALFAYLVALRLWSRGDEHPVLKRIGMGIVVVVSLQLVLGLVAFMLVLARRSDWLAAEVIMATAHQANGAVLLLLSAQAVAWTRREEALAPAPAGVPSAV